MRCKEKKTSSTQQSIQIDTNYLVVAGCFLAFGFVYFYSPFFIFSSHQIKWANELVQAQLYNTAGQCTFGYGNGFWKYSQRINRKFHAQNHNQKKIRQSLANFGHWTGIKAKFVIYFQHQWFFKKKNHASLLIGRHS